MLTKQQDAFAVHFATYGDAQAAYRSAYNVGDTTKRSSVQQRAWELRHHPKIAARITALRNADAAGELASRERLIADLEALCEVNIDEFMELRIIPCPACWPLDAWETAAVTALDAGHEPPAANEPNPLCQPCGGAGRPITHLVPTAQWSAVAKRLFKGVELYSDQTVKRILLHDQAQLRIELHRLKGLHIERSVSVNAHVNIPALPKNLSVSDALELLNTLAPVPADADDTPIDDNSVVSIQE